MLVRLEVSASLQPPNVGPCAGGTVPVRWGRFPLDLPRLPMSMLMVIVAADIFGIAEWATGDHAEQSRLFYRSAFGIGTVGVAIKALLAGSGL
jgi:hypothetical protein